MMSGILVFRTFSLKISSFPFDFKMLYINESENPLAGSCVFLGLIIPLALSTIVFCGHFVRQICHTHKITYCMYLAAAAFL